MKHRIRAAGVALNENKILMLKVEDEFSGEYWILPGGGLEEQDTTTKSALAREFHEETGLSVSVGELLCVREFREVSRAVYHLELFYLVNEWHGDISLSNLKGLNDANYIKEVRWVSLGDLEQKKVFPKDLVTEVIPLVKQKRYSKHLGSYVQGKSDDINLLD